MNCRVILTALVRCWAIASRPDDFSQACALSMFSNSVTPKRLGGSPITAVILSVGPKRHQSNGRRLPASPTHGEHGGWDDEAEHPGGFGVDDQFELGRLHDRQFHRLRALKNPPSIDADLTQGLRKVGTVAYKPPTSTYSRSP